MTRWNAPGRRGAPATQWPGRIAGLLVALTAALGPAAVAGPAALATPEPTGDCTTTSGVIVAVDFAHWGGPVLRSCGTTPTSAYTLLNQGGWHTTGTEHDGPGFICRIGYAGYHGGTQYPAPSQEPCVLTPPTSAYWAFWYANRGQNRWSYSQSGAMGIQPEPGSVELWVFGGTNVGGTSGSAVPGLAPASLRATKPGQQGAVRGSSSPAENPSTPTRPASSATHPAAPPSATTPTSGPAAPAPAMVRNAQPTAASAPVSHGSARPAIAALVIVVILVVIGIVAAARRPRREQ